MEQQDTLENQEQRCAVYCSRNYIYSNVRELPELKEDKGHRVSKVVVVTQDSLEIQEHKEAE